MFFERRKKKKLDEFTFYGTPVGLEQFHDPVWPVCCFLLEPAIIISSLLAGQPLKTVPKYFISAPNSISIFRLGKSLLIVSAYFYASPFIDFVLGKKSETLWTISSKTRWLERTLSRQISRIRFDLIPQRLDLWPDRIALKKLLIEHSKGYRMVFKTLKSVDK